MSSKGELLDAVRDRFIMSITDASGNIVEVNDAFCLISKYSREELIGANHRLVNSGQQPPGFFEDMWWQISSGNSWRGEICNRAKDGSLYWVDSVIAPLYGEDGLIERYVSIRSDITARKMQEAALREVEQANGALLDTVRDRFIMSITDARGTIIEVNDAFCAISQYRRDELTGANHRLVNSGHQPPGFFDEMWWQISSGNSWRGEICNRAKDGSLYWVDSVIAPLRGPDGRIDRYVSIRSDISGRKWQEERLRKSELLLNRTGELAEVGGWELDLSSEEFFWTEQTCRLHGVPTGHRPRLDEALSFFPPMSQELIKAAVDRATQQGEDWDLELPLVQQGGQQIWVRMVGHVEFAHGRPVRLLGAFQNITARVQKRQALESAHERMSLATDSGGIGIWDYDLESGELTWDAWMYRLYGLPAETKGLAYEHWAKQLHPDDRASSEQAVRDAIAGTRRYDIEFRILWADGSVHHLRSTARVKRDGHGKAVRMVGVNWDVTQTRRLTAELAEQHELLSVTLNAIGDAVITTDRLGQVNWLNPAAERMTGWMASEAKGRPLLQVFQIVYEGSRNPKQNPVSLCLEQGKVVAVAHDTLLISRDGDEFGIEDSAAPIRNAHGEVLGAVLVFHDVTEQRRLSGEMRYRATHDVLTGLVNRGEFEARLRRTLIRAHEDGSEHALLFIDLDQFKLVNDACGHGVGDELLMQVAKMLGDVVRARDTLARLGGDEFAMLLEHCTCEQAQRAAQQICDRMDEFRFVHDGQRFRIGASIGLVPLDQRWGTTVAAMQAADTACYAAKEGGRNRVHIWFDTDLAMRARQGESHWATRLEQALDEGRFVLFAQRIDAIGQADGPLHAEVLLRMRDGDGGVIPPGAFLPAAERFHLAARIDRWVLRHAIECLRALPALEAVQLLSVNLSGQSIGDRSFHTHTLEQLEAADPSICRRLCLEVTETAAVTNLIDASHFIKKVRALGVKIALDDFGAGASSFGYLKSLPVDLLKIDGQFIRSLVDDALDDAAVRCFVDVARVMSMKTVAEFVDRPETLKRLAEIGIDFVQGYLLHRPEPIERLLGLPMGQYLRGTGSSAGIPSPLPAAPGLSFYGSAT